MTEEQIRDYEKRIFDLKDALKTTEYYIAVVHQPSPMLYDMKLRYINLIHDLENEFADKLLLEDTAPADRGL